MDLIPTLKSQHNAVIELVEKLEAAMAVKDVAEVQSVLGTMGGALIGHLELEDRELYPGLIRYAEEQNDPHLALVATNFMQNMGRISEALIAFLKQYAEPGFDLQKFDRDWTGIKKTLVDRIHAEENTLYALFTRAQKRAASSPVSKAV